ncbi:MAG TPA: outer membrane lipoprotein carrier protein LolA [Bryobacteraceae bacterium]|nr:outer membrane lipoprotein carrier protein LolA [Bryobacteraceae bacterium]
MNFLHSRFLLLSSVLAATVPNLAAGSLEATFAKMDRAASMFSGVTADLRRLNHMALLNEDTAETGTFRMKRTKRDVRVLFDIKQPEPKAYSFDGKKLEEYLPAEQTVQEYDAGKYKSLADQFLLLGFGTTSKELQAEYTISLGGSERIANEQTTRLELIPKSKELILHLPKVDLWISDQTGVPVQQKFYSPGGNYNLATYSNIMLNPNLPDSAVRLDLPKGVTRQHPLK